MSDLEKLAAPPPRLIRAKNRNKKPDAPKAPVSPLSDLAPQPTSAPVVPQAAARRADGRVPLGMRKLKLDFPKRDGYKRRVINDSPGRIQSALDGGYAFVEQNGKRVTRPVGQAERGGGLTGYLMEIPYDLWKPDQDDKQAEIDIVDAQIQGGALHAKPGDMFYQPVRSQGVPFTNFQVQKGTGK